MVRSAMRVIDWIGIWFACAISSSGIGVVYVLRRRERAWDRDEELRQLQRPTLPRAPLSSREAWIEACGSDARSCVVCDLIIRPGARMWTRIHGSVVSYMHEACADANGEALVRPRG